MALVRCSSEETADLVGSEIWYYVCSGLELVSYALYMVSLHYAKHNFLIDSEGNIYFRSFHHCGPVLIADGVSEFYA